MERSHDVLELSSRRSLLKQSARGFGYLAMCSLLAGEQLRAGLRREVAPLQSKSPHIPARAKRIIFLFMEGAMSQLDTFEYKPELQRRDGEAGPGGGRLVGSKFRFSRHGETGTWVSELYPHVAKHVDRLCFLRGLWTDTPAHPQAVIQLHTGTRIASVARPSLGAWLLYGLGTENTDLPGYVTINPSPNFGGAVNYGSAFLPSYYEGTKITDRGFLPNLKAVDPGGLQRRQIDFLQARNRELAQDAGAPAALDGLIESWELAFRMQDSIPRLLDFSDEPRHIQDAYGVRDGVLGSFARQCLLARRLSESGVRFVEVRQGGWDHHNNLHRGLQTNASATDQPVAALLADLEQRGLLEETLVLFGSEFGRMPTAQGADGRDHNITGYPMWLAGAGVKSGFSWGDTDEFGLRAVEQRMHTTDLHATLLALLGLDHERLTFQYAGRDFRLTDVEGQVASEIFS
ncbi:MAG TPA: DUF1501 domain-containing protein [Planctomycetaceae bacterium]|nr:DUF1501 domain-containing protein [Planctomycetaceae bacterium]HBC60346.1 DUF1501 domain-containing protein [Planctomycetaceae bacterium]